MSKKISSLIILIFVSILSFGQTLQDSLKAHYKFDGTVLDATSNGEDLKTPTNPDYRLVSGFDSAYYFDGNTRLEGDTSFDNSTYTETTISFWVKASSNSSQQDLIQGENMGFGVSIVANTGKLYLFFDGSSSGAPRTSISISNNEWHHIIGQNNGNTTSIYIDGILDTSKAENLSVGNGMSNNQLYIGNSNLNANPYTGSLNDIRIYNRILSKCEIAELAKVNSLEGDLKAHYKFDGDVLDETSNDEDIKAPISPSYELVDGADSAYSFDGNTRLQTNTNFDNSSYTEMVLSLWIKTSTTDYSNIISGAYLGFGAVMDANGKIMFVFDSSTSGALKTKKSLNDNKWHHILGQNNGSKTSIYVDGVLDSSVTETLYNGNGAANNIIYFGNSLVGPSINSEYYDGLLNNVRIYDRILSECEIDSLYKQEKPASLVISSVFNEFEDIKKEAFVIYPNPTNGNVYLKIENPALYSSLRIRNTVGQVILSKTISQSEINSFEIDGPKGIYFIEIIEFDGRVNTSKIIKN